MTILLEIPDDLVAALTPPGQELSRSALEALAVDGYRSGRLTETDVGKLLGIASRLEVQAFLKERGAFLPYALHVQAHERDVAHHAARLARVQHQKAPANDRRRR